MTLTDFIIILTSAQCNESVTIHVLLVMIPLVLYYINYISKELMCSKVLSIVYMLTDVPKTTRDERSQL